MKDRIKQVRSMSGLSTRDFADRIGMTCGSISLLENGKRNPTERTIRDICREFSVSEAWLRFGIGEMHEVKESSDFLELAQDLDLSADQYDIEIQGIAADLIRTWAELTPEYKRVILEVAHRFRDKKKKDR